LVTCVVAWATPACSAPPFITDDPAPTADHTFEIYIFGNGTATRDGVSGSYGLDFNYGAGPDLQLSATVPVTYERPDGGHQTSGLGNIELAAKFRVLHQESFGWDVAVFPRVFLPSGSNLGEQHASFLVPIWVGKDWERWATFGGGGCALNRGAGSQDYCIAGWVLTRRVLPNLQFGGEIFHQSSDTKDGHATTILGLGATYDFSEHLHLLGYLGEGLENTDETGRATGYASILFTF